MTNYTRVWAMPSADTFDIPPIGQLVKRYLRTSKVIVDPFARNKRWATYTNDLNPATAAEWHMDALDFLVMLKEKRIQADLVLFDPPYSLEQLKRSYGDIGREYESEDGWKPGRWTNEKNLINSFLVTNGIFINFGWNSYGMGKERGFEIIEGGLFCHGAGHNDTIVTVERKITHQENLFDYATGAGAEAREAVRR